MQVSVKTRHSYIAPKCKSSSFNLAQKRDSIIWKSVQGQHQTEHVIYSIVFFKFCKYLEVCLMLIGAFQFWLK
jgi:hypothetical protein